jgi:hypothetical protein
MDYLTMQHQVTRFLPVLTAAVAAFGISACEVEKKQEGEMPKVNVEGGKMPEYDVKGPDVKVEQQKKEITVPDIDIITPKEKREGGNVESGDPGKPATPEPAAPAPNP